MSSVVGKQSGKCKYSSLILDCVNKCGIQIGTGNYHHKSLKNNIRYFSINLMRRTTMDPKGFSLLSYVKEQESKRRKKEDEKADLIFKKQIKLMNKAMKEQEVIQSTAVDDVIVIERKRDWNDLTAIFFQNYILDLLTRMIQEIRLNNTNQVISLESEPSMPLTTDEKNSIREKFRYRVDTTSVQFFDKIMKTDTVRPDLKIEIDGKKFIFDSKHYNSKSVRKSSLIGKVIIGSDESKMKRNEVSIYEVVKLYRDIHAFGADGGGLILSPTTILSYSAKLLMEELNFITIKLTNRKSSPSTIKKEIQQFINLNIDNSASK